MEWEIRYYVGQEIAISFDACRSSHATECVRRLLQVFDTTRRPWIEPGWAAV